MDLRADSAYYLERYAFGSAHVWHMVRTYGKRRSAEILATGSAGNRQWGSEGYCDAIDHAFGR